MYLARPKRHHPACMKSVIASHERCRISYMAVLTSLERLRTLGAVFRASDARDAGVSWRDLYQLRDDGTILALSRGTYQLAERGGMGEIDFVTVCRRAPGGMICLNSALAYWDLTDENPSHIHLAVPKGTTRPAIDHPPTAVHVFDPGTFDLGRRPVNVDHGARFSITDRERTLVDVHRLRHRVGDDIAAHALRRYLDQPRPDIPQLLDYARALRAERGMRAAVQLLMA